MKKTCTKCQIPKEIDDFCIVRKNKDGRNTRCKKCCKQLCSGWRAKESSLDKIQNSRVKWESNNHSKRIQYRKNYRTRNPERARAIVRKSLHKNKEKYKPQKWRQAIKRLYNLDAEDFYRIQKEQNNLCAICGLHEKDAKRQKLCVDHCHDTKVVRGLLCFSCNVLLGSAQDNPDILIKAAEYLKKFPKVQEKENECKRPTTRSES